MQVSVKAGAHERYVFQDEIEGNPAKLNERLTSEYGWYFVCNDRVIKIGSREPEFGWAKRWHNEYYGFVGWVYFTGDAKSLPWNTKKTDIDPNSIVFKSIKNTLKSYATLYRTQNRNLKKGKVEKPNTETTPSTSPQIDLLSEEESSVKSSESYSDINDGEKTEKPSDQESANKPTEVVTYRPSTKIDRSDKIAEKLSNLGEKKLENLYQSLHSTSLVNHSVLMSIGAWAFFEALARRCGSDGSSSFSAHFNNKLNSWYAKEKKVRATYKKIISDISERGNLDKHDGIYYTVDAKQLAVDFDTLEPFILRTLEDIESIQRETEVS